MGSIISLPYMVLFFVWWLVASLARPLTVATIICLLLNPVAAKVKLALFYKAFQYLVLCKDKKWKKSTEDPEMHFKDLDQAQNQDAGAGDDATGDETIESKTVIFLRHGESTWNDTFNRGDRPKNKFLMGFVPGIVKSFATEWYFLVTGKSRESWFYDSPLSAKGQGQAESARKFLKETNPKYSTPKEAKLIRILNGDPQEKKSKITSSNLRRAISTVAIALRDRLDKHIDDDKIVILQELQEVSFNPDAQSISPPFAPLIDSWMDSEHTKAVYANQCDTSHNKGNKDVSAKGIDRLQAFSQFVFENVTEHNVIATGHSYWFRAFFQTYLPHSFDHVCKKKKLINGGIAGFTLLRKKTDSGYKYMIDPKSVTVLYGGF